MSHSAEIIAVGTELLLGNITNTNARDISRALSAVGVNVFWHTVVGDNPERLRAALDIARAKGLRLPIVCNTGGYETVESVEAWRGDIDIWLAGPHL